MLTLYIVSAAVAGVLILLSLMGADHGVEHEVHFDHDSDHDSEHSGHWLPFFSLRFYTYFFAGLGVTGLLLHWLTDTQATLALWLALGVGVFPSTSEVPEESDVAAVSLDPSVPLLLSPISTYCNQ